jgi:hypothetical protein
MNKLYFIILLFTILIGCNESSRQNTDTSHSNTQGTPTQSSQYYNQCEYTQLVGQLENYYETKGGARSIYQAQPKMVYLIAKIEQTLNNMGHGCSNETARLEQLLYNTRIYKVKLDRAIESSFDASNEAADVLNQDWSLLD